MIVFDGEYLNFNDTLNCGQVFRFERTDDGFFVLSRDKIAKVYNLDKKAYIVSDDDEYFRRYFDLDKDYAKIKQSITKCNIDKVLKVCQKYQGIRILAQDKEEAFFSFIISQNNNIPKIKSSIEKLSASLGKKQTFLGKEYYSFPTAAAISEADITILQQAGLGYRANYIKDAAIDIKEGKINLEGLSRLDTPSLKQALLSIRGVGDKVANCISLFGFSRSDSFPVDTWIEKIYREDFGGTLTDRRKISDYFLQLFKENSGYVQQYLFYAKRENFI